MFAEAIVKAGQARGAGHWGNPTVRGAGADQERELKNLSANIAGWRSLIALVEVKAKSVEEAIAIVESGLDRARLRADAGDLALADARGRIELALNNAEYLLDQYEVSGDRRDLDNAEVELATAKTLLHRAAELFAAWGAGLVALDKAVTRAEAMNNQEVRARLDGWRQRLETYRDSMTAKRGAIYDFIEGTLGTDAAETWLEGARKLGSFAKGTAIAVGVIGSTVILVPLGWWAVKRLLR